MDVKTVNLLLAIHSWSGANEILARHWPYFQNAGASSIVGIGTDGSHRSYPEPTLAKCVFPKGVDDIAIIGDDAYMAGNNLVRRLMETMDWMLGQPPYWPAEDRFAIVEYDTIFLRPVPEFTGTAAYQAGGPTWGSKAATGFYHNPWLFDRDDGTRLVQQLGHILAEGHCKYGTPESSPDVAFAWACERAGIEVQQLLKEYSQNTLDLPHFLDEAREAVRAGAHCIHGVKTAEQLDYILS